MPNIRSPRHGSMQYWPRVRSKRNYARVRNQIRPKEAKLAGFAGYKVGMTHVIIEDNYKNSLTKGKEVSLPATIIECPPIKVFGTRFYTTDAENGDLKVLTEIITDKADKNLKRKIRVGKKLNKKFEDISEYTELRLLVYTQPNLTSLNKKKPEIFEMVIGGSKEEQLAFAKENLGKEVKISEVFKEGQFVDASGITKGKGYQGPVKRFGVNIRNHRSEKTKRGPGSINGGWKAHAHMMYRVAYAGQMGKFQRKEFNKWVLKISDNPEEINAKGGFLRYGNVKNTYMLLKGSVMGASKRLITFIPSVRPHQPLGVANIKYISTESRQK